MTRNMGNCYCLRMTGFIAWHFWDLMIMEKKKKNLNATVSVSVKTLYFFSTLAFLLKQFTFFS